MRETFTAEVDGTLLPFLFEKLPEVKRTKVRQWLKFDGIQVNGKVAKHSTHPIVAGDVVTLAPTAKPPPGPALPAGMQLIHEDASVIVILKPAKLLSIATKTGNDVTAYSELTEYVKQTHPRGKDRIFIVHRLDRDTSGLMVFARSEEAKSELQNNWKRASKKYFAVVDGLPPAKSGTLCSHLDESNQLRVRSAPAGAGTREAITHYRVLRKTEKRSVLELTLETGRRHQIRVQLADIGCPIIGDEKYHPDSDLPKAERPVSERPKRLALHAAELSFPHPETGELMQFTSELPVEMARMMKSSTRHERRRKK
ncbi:MAG: RluA family pseudouridine synthase [Verrucomicrobiales bacterium]|nr:RluA family pseudouridine synthase [Verrucomicrobiales bacterium]